MKVLLIATLMISSAFAEEADKGQKLEDIKARIVSNIDQRINLQNQHKSCVQSAATKEALKQCQSTHREAMRSLKSENTGERQAFREKWKAKREARRAEKMAEKKKK